MPGETNRADFGSVEAVVAYLKERADDIEKAVIPQSEVISIPETGEEIPAGMVLHMVNDRTKIIMPPAAEAILNDGILNRLRIKIELGRAKPWDA
ncbi:MAG TPA: hypothetical protein VHY91_05450 [Pirellulales bacterium]|jgi:hypothetical protein|nr:hypothetical protein [Pirellulales bacterium]